MNKQKKLVPKLRFPEFQGGEGWGNAVLGDLSEVVRGGSPRPIDGFLTTDANGLNWLKIGDVDKEAKYVTRTAEKVRPEALGKTRVVKPGDLILSNSMSFGRPYILQVETCIHDGWIAVTDIVSEAARDFLYYSISAPDSQSYFTDNAAGSGVQNLNADIIKALPVRLPKPAEQQKIADFLSSLDELIAAQASKVEALKTHKKGLMQQLFPCKGETQPRLRFPEFRDAGEWEPTTIGDIGNFYYGKSAPKWSLDESASTPCVRYGELYTKFGAVITETYSRTTIDPNNLRFSKGGEILVPRVGEKPEDFGKCCSYLPLSNVAIGEMISVFETEQNPLFYTHYFRSLYRQFAAVVEGQNVKNLYYTELEPLAISRPTLDEQQRIADCLTTLDDLITAATQELDTLKTHKKGLMQQLFPQTTSEATA
jgi:type I restriction enzyme S subunit